MMGQSGDWNAVWKYEIQVEDEFTVEMPRLAQVIHVAVQDNRPCMWALVNPAQPPTTRTFHVHGTGHRVDPQMVHLGSFLLLGGNFVGHLFEHRTARS